MNMNTRYIALATLMLIMGAGLLLLPVQQNTDEAPPEVLLQELNDDTRYYSTDEVAQMIIDQDPSILLIDVRSPEEYEKFSLEGALNIPFDRMLDEDNLALLEDDRRSLILFSNGDLRAEQAWLLCRRMGLTHLQVMYGGLNRWAETILMPEPPQAAAPKGEIDLYQTRLGARQYFTGINPVSTERDEQEKEKPEAVIPVQRQKQSVIEGGC